MQYNSRYSEKGDETTPSVYVTLLYLPTVVSSREYKAVQVSDIILEMIFCISTATPWIHAEILWSHTVLQGTFPYLATINSF